MCNNVDLNEKISVVRNSKVQNCFRYCFHNKAFSLVRKMIKLTIIHVEYVIFLLDIFKLVRISYCLTE